MFDLFGVLHNERCPARLDPAKKKRKTAILKAKGGQTCRLQQFGFPKKRERKSAHARLHSRKPSKNEHLARETRKFPRCDDGKKGIARSKEKGEREAAVASSSRKNPSTHRKRSAGIVLCYQLHHVSNSWFPQSLQNK